jgi:hypothetical protein
MRPTAGNADLRPSQNAWRPPRLRNPERAGAVVAGYRLDPAEQAFDLTVRAVQLDDEERFHVERVAGMDVISAA